MKLESSTGSISAKLLTQILGIYFLFAILATVSQLYVEFQSEKTQLKNEIRSIISTFNPIFVQSVWSLNNAQLESNIKGVMRNPKVIGVKILDEKGELMKALGIIRDKDGTYHTAISADEPFTKVAPDNRWQEFYEFRSKLEYNSKTRGNKAIGYLYLYSNSDPILSELSSTFIITVMSAILKTLFLWVIATIIIRRNISDPLTVISSAMDKLIPQKHKQTDTDLQSMQSKQDELSKLMATFVSMKLALENKEKEVNNYQQGLEDAKAALEIKVKERTLELEKLNEKLLQASNTDQLTQLHNRRYFDEHATNHYMFCVRQHEPLAIIIIDIDHFKLVNDNYGHDIGDKCLQTVANTLQKCVHRSSDIVARFGGEEFIVLLPQTEAEDAFNIAEKIRISIENTLFYANGTLLPITASLGVSTLAPDSRVPLAELIKQADQALYTSKQEGRNQSTLFPTLTDPKQIKSHSDRAADK